MKCLILMPSIKISPRSTSKKRMRSLTTVVLPTPEEPTKAIDWPWRILRSKFWRAGFFASGYVKVTLRNSISPATEVLDTGWAGSLIKVFWSRMSKYFSTSVRFLTRSRSLKINSKNRG